MQEYGTASESELWLQRSNFTHISTLVSYHLLGNAQGVNFWPGGNGNCDVLCTHIT